jgi:DNA-binding transcriptional ArsR family regulator
MASEKFLLVSLKEDEAKKLAQVISNDTSRKILDFLASRKDATETEIATHLEMPLSTTHYNL